MKVSPSGKLLAESINLHVCKVLAAKTKLIMNRLEESASNLSITSEKTNKQVHRSAKCILQENSAAQSVAKNGENGGKDAPSCENLSNHKRMKFKLLGQH